MLQEEYSSSRSSSEFLSSTDWPVTVLFTVTSLTALHYTTAQLLLFLSLEKKKIFLLLCIGAVRGSFHFF
jgi:hypothetical protein